MSKTDLSLTLSAFSAAAVVLRMVAAALRGVYRMGVRDGRADRETRPPEVKDPMGFR
jgi:hypothetical protein